MGAKRRSSVYQSKVNYGSWSSEKAVAGSERPTAVSRAAWLVSFCQFGLFCHLSIEVPHYRRRRRLPVLNTRAEHDRLIEAESLWQAGDLRAFEATGNYHRPIAWRRIEAGFAVRLVSSMALARTRAALPNGWNKNDPRDAQVILHMLRIGATQCNLDAAVPGRLKRGPSCMQTTGPHSLLIDRPYFSHLLKEMTAMEFYAALDFALEKTALCIVDGDGASPHFCSNADGRATPTLA